MPCSEAGYRYRLIRANTGDRVIAGRGTACLGGQIMACTLHVAWDDRLAGYDFGAGHPLAPVRLELTIELARAFGLLAAAGVSVERPAPATDTELSLVHIQPYIAAVRRAGGPEPDVAMLEFGLGTEDNPVFAGMHHASALVVGATLAAARAVWTGTAQHGASIAGGLHHAMPASGSGFCVYNDPAIAISWLLAAGASRVAYVDIDVHHADGVQAAFYDNPQVLTISLHEHPATAFPGTGLPSETGGPGARGSAVNVALPAGTGDAGWLRALDGVVPPLLRAFRPQILVSQHGCDSHWLDPMAGLRLSIDAQRCSRPGAAPASAATPSSTSSPGTPPRPPAPARQSPLSTSRPTSCATRRPCHCCTQASTSPSSPCGSAAPRGAVLVSPAQRAEMRGVISGSDG